MLHSRLHEQHRQTRGLLSATLAEDSDGDPGAAFARDAAASFQAGRLGALSAAGRGLCFGRLDGIDGDTTHIGRLGIFDEENDYAPLLLDWRAPAARPFYCATAVHNQGVARRRHLQVRGRTVVGLTDEILAPGTGFTTEDSQENALFAAMDERRTGQMRDIVATIQAEQDEAVRAPDTGVLVVDGGPGTGKTAVALHRAAYLLYTHRQRLSRRGVLIVGPTPGFLDYIDQVLPSLGETEALFATVGELFPGVIATAGEPDATARLKGRAVMTRVLAAAVADRQEARHCEIEFDDQILVITEEECTAIRDRARETGLPHNLARPYFRRAITAALAENSAAQLGREFLDDTDLAQIEQELVEDRGVRLLLDELWPSLTPQRLLTDLYATKDRLDTAATCLTEDERRALHRTSPQWTPADVPLLDEAAELLGVDDRAERFQATAAREAALDYAAGLLDVLSFDAEDEDDGRNPAQFIDVEALAERDEVADHRTVAERAAADRTWTFGHVIVDEAQELPEMAWRLLMRRCPSRSMTLVGDLAQAGATSSGLSWAELLGPYVGDRWRHHRLTVNYRVPGEIMAMAAAVLGEPAPESARHTGTEPVFHPLAARAELVAAAAELGSVAVIAAEPRAGVLTPQQAKGLEFDTVIVEEPARIAATSHRGDNDLYVALTRPTQHLFVVHDEPVPEAMIRHRIPR